jgi:hypothetical protein
MHPQPRHASEEASPNHEARDLKAPEGGRETTSTKTDDDVGRGPFLTPRLHKKKSSYDLRDEFQHGEAGHDGYVSPDTNAPERRDQSESLKGDNHTEGNVKG